MATRIETSRLHKRHIGAVTVVPGTSTTVTAGRAQRADDRGFPNFNGVNILVHDVTIGV
jgi:hypothetical protein